MIKLINYASRTHFQCQKRNTGSALQNGVEFVTNYGYQDWTMTSRPSMPTSCLIRGEPGCGAGSPTSSSKPFWKWPPTTR